MAMSGLQIQKLLPKTNCKECGSNTCLAFAMKLAAKKASLSECPYASDEAKVALALESEPPVRRVPIGSGGDAVGEETVLYRHEKTFVNKTLFAVEICCCDLEAEDVLAAIRDYRLERVGEVLTVSAVAVSQSCEDEGCFLGLVKKALDITGLPLIIHAWDLSFAKKAAELAKGTRSVIAHVNEGNADELRAAAEEFGHALAVTAPDMDGMAELTSRLRDGGFNDIVMSFQTHSMAEAFQTNSIARRAAIAHHAKELGYATLRYVGRPPLKEPRTAENELDILMRDTARAIVEVNKYGGICVLPCFDPAQLVTLMALRLNIFTDPQKPIQVEPKVYAIGEPGRDSPVFVTTNFSLTYFLVSGEIENSGISAWLVIPECEGMSVLTAWAAGKFSGGSIAKFAKESGLEDMVDTRSIIIPGYVAQISGELEESLPGWKVMVGPQEAGDIEGYVKAVLTK
ncbi:MAG: acetyl-CoA decarbonylase/synthase complex subunit gamma [Defluviitaleaceae bacterium]|nr:acetyl-CoA decarbonylase/synthase complex subunit gamma [Defluviitaleaceae bacterium]